MVLIIALFEKTDTIFAHNGICTLNPISCTVTEVAGGQYELELVHPLDEHKKYLMLTEERLIRAPVPVRHLPEITLPELKVWRVTTATGLMSKVPTTKYTQSTISGIALVAANPQQYAWSAVKAYNTGSLVLYGSYVYKAIRFSYNVQPGTNGNVWSNLGSLTGSGATTPVVDEGTRLANLTVGTLIYRIADVGDYMQVRTQDGKVGFILRSTCAEQTEHYEETIPEQTISTQVFRIYSTECDEQAGTYTVRAKHISYDLRNNCLYDCKVTDQKPLEAIASLQAALMEHDDRAIACDITTGKITKDWSFKNPVNALLDPDEGLVPELDAILIRNNEDFYILKPDHAQDGITIRYGVNMLGVNWTRSVENVITRIVPRSGAETQGYTYIGDGGRISGGTVTNQHKTYVESEIADQYAMPHIAVMNCPYSVGQSYTDSAGVKQTYDEATVKAKLKEDALKQFVDDHVDGVDITLDVEFLLLGDTEEYKQYRGLQTVNLYDRVKVVTGKSQIEAVAQVTEYEYDSINKRYISIKLGTVNSFNRRVPGYRVVSGSITYDKLAPDLINRIVSDNASGTADSGSVMGDPSGGGYPMGATEVVDNLTSTATDKALSANQGRMLNTSKQAVLHYADRTVTSLSIASDGGYASVGTLSDFGLTTSNYIVGFFIRGWSGSPGALSLVAATNGQTIYVMCSKAGTISSLTVRLWYY